MLKDVLLRIAADTGYHPTQQRDALIVLLQNAAKSIYSKLEVGSAYREVTLVVPRNKVVSIPSFVGELKGMRAHVGDYPFDLNALLTPRYVSGKWNYKLRNWRDLGESPVHTYVGSINLLTFESAVLEGTTISVSGQTSNANRIEENILLDASPKQTVNLFGPTIYCISCDTVRTCNVIVKDIDGTEIAILYNTDQQTRYKIVDVSEMFWGVDTLNDETLVDVAYKLPLGALTKDIDGFPAGPAYDEAWYSMAMHLYYKPMQGKDVQASDAYKYALVSLSSIKGESEDSVVKKLNFGPNKYYGLFKGGCSGYSSCTHE